MREFDRQKRRGDRAPLPYSFLSLKKTVYLLLIEIDKVAEFEMISIQ
jgi:hypothetical protein